MGSAGISSAVLGHTPSPYRSNAHINVYTGQNFTRPQHFHGSFQQNMCNGYGSTNEGTQSRNGLRSSGISTRRNSTGSPVPSLSLTNVYIRGLEQNTTDEDLRDMCAKFGRIASTKAIMDKATGQCKRYGFVDFEEAADALRAVEGLNQEGKVRAQMAKQQEQDPTNLYLANLPPNYTERDLQKLLESYGSTISTRVLKNGDGSSRCVGFARMDNEELCAKIIKEMNGKKIIPGCNLPLMVKYADSNKKTKSRPLQSVPGLYSSLTHLEITQPCFATPPYDQSGQYIRSNPNYQYLLTPPSPYVYSPHPQYHVFSGYGDAPMGNLAAQMQNLSLQGANAILHPSAELTNIGPGTSMTANQAPAGTAIPQVAMQAYTVPLYPWPYGVQATTDPNMIGTVVTSATPLQNFVPELAAMHTDAANVAAATAAAGAVPTNQTSGQVIYTSQPPPPPPPPPPPSQAPAPQMQQN
ncbi:RNA binding protein, putative [Brugia malayi]|uniref:Protein alan shepard n=1 Tax=Brugia malayi TaxID=6279 RepID=A0A4E9FBW1_BRUMA|nr:RNA binding protein, putative [Brugia malayi]VIO92208.1 RNA binding protein, putative [Brugia malayi]